MQKGFASPDADFENRTFSVMAGGDYALIKSVEGFEDFTAFGKNRSPTWRVGERRGVRHHGRRRNFVRHRHGVGGRGGEGAKVYFVYNNPDDILVRARRAQPRSHPGRASKK
jgi:hypothetical protein